MQNVFNKQKNYFAYFFYAMVQHCEYFSNLKLTRTPLCHIK